jgi:hypothetical protein
MTRLISALVFAAIFLLISRATDGQTLGPGQLLRLTPTALPARCSIGDLRVDTADSYKLKLCNALNTWSEITPTGAIINPMTTQGDLVIGASGGTPARLALGTTNQILQSNGTTATWVNIPVDAITALTGDVSASGAGSVAATLATVNSNVGSFGSASNSPSFTVNAKGLVTAASESAIAIGQTQVTNLVSDLAGKQPTGNYITALTGDISAAGPGSAGATLPTVNSNVGAFGSASSVGTFTVNGKGLITAAGSSAIAIGQSAVTNLTSDLALKLTDPMTTNGDIITRAAGVPARLGIGATNSVLTSSGSAPQWSTVLPIASGGTNNASLPVTAGGVLFTNGTQVGNVGVGTTGQVLISNGALAPTWATNSASLTAYPPSTQTLTSGSTYNKDYTFVISSGSATVGATYTHNSVTYTVQATVASQTQIVLSGSAAPLTSGTLTKASGTGDTTLTFSAFASPLYLEVVCTGGGGSGGGGGNSSTPTAGSTGNTTTFGSTLLSCTGGTGGTTGNAAGGTCTITAPAYGVAYTGNPGTGFNAAGGIAVYPGTSLGGGSVCFGGGNGGSANSAGDAGVANTGGGGGGGNSAVAVAERWSMSGGGGGGCARIYVRNPAATYAYSIAAAQSTVGAAGTNGYAGGAGAAGRCDVTAHYQ